MELLIALGLTPQFLLNFFIWGLSLNITAMLLTRVVVYFTIKQFNQEQRDYMNQWFLRRAAYIKQNNSPNKIIASFLTLFLPTYVWGLNMIYLFYLMQKPGLPGLLYGQMKYDQFSIVQLTKYQHIPAEK
ncbi:hypothetical protein WCWAEYFT_CDS0278 [Vibrio phage VB_VaC_TDDLMA]